jgi:hypothetical protein
VTFEREFMAAACLGIVWINTGLIVAHGLGDLRRIVRLGRRLAGTVGRFTVDDSDGGAAFRLIQAGRTRGDGSIYFHDRASECSLSGSARAELRQGTVPLAKDPGTLWVWPTDEEIQAATECRSQADYDALATPALHARGAERVAVVRLNQGSIAGGRVTDGALCGDPEHPIIISSRDPRRQLRLLVLRAAVVLTGILVSAFALTALCFVGPAFGLVSMLGALGLFLYFLLVQPVGVWLSESVRWPHEAPRGGVWVRRRLPAAQTVELGSTALSS